MVGRGEAQPEQTRPGERADSREPQPRQTSSGTGGSKRDVQVHQGAFSIGAEFRGCSIQMLREIPQESSPSTGLLGRCGLCLTHDGSIPVALRVKVH